MPTRGNFYLKYKTSSGTWDHTACYGQVWDQNWDLFMAAHVLNHYTTTGSLRNTTHAFLFDIWRSLGIPWTCNELEVQQCKKKTIRIVHCSVSTIMADIFPASVNNPDPYPISGVYLPRMLFNTHAMIAFIQSQRRTCKSLLFQILSHLCQRYCIMSVPLCVWVIFVLSPYRIFLIRNPKWRHATTLGLKIRPTVNKLKYK